MTLGTALHAFVGYGLASWMPSFLMRSHDMGSGAVATWLALVVGFGGAAGTLVGGIWAERWARRDQRWYVWLPALAGLVAIPFLCFTYLYSDPSVAIAVYAIPVFLNSFWSGPVHAVGQTVAPVRMRTLAAAGMMFFTNAIGLGLGPQVVGVISDSLNPWAQNDSLRYALLSVVVVNIWSSWHYWRAAKTLRKDISAGRG